MTDDRRLIEDYLPIQAIGRAATSEPRTKGHISTLHLWRARRPLVACRAAVFGALVPLSTFVPENAPEDKRGSLTRANIARFVEGLCTYPGYAQSIAKARNHLLEAHAERLSKETGEPVTVQDILDGKAARPKVLDMFTGGGAIPLEALRLGCEAHGIEINPVAHIIELCTLVYPQQFGKSDLNSQGMTGQQNGQGETTWGGLAAEIRYWAEHIVAVVKGDVGDLYPAIHDPSSSEEIGASSQERMDFVKDRQLRLASGSGLTPIAYLWTRTLVCPNPSCGGTVPLYRQTWLRNKSSGYVALRPIPDQETKQVRFEVVHATSPSEFDFDPTAGINNTSTSCLFCQTGVSADYVRKYGDSRGYGQQLMCVITNNPRGSGKLYIAGEELLSGEDERLALAEERANTIEEELGNSSLDEEIQPTGNAGLATGKSYLYGIKTFRQAFNSRQRYVLLAMAKAIHAAHAEMVGAGVSEEAAKSVATYLGLWVSRLIDRLNGLARWDSSRENIQGLTSLKRFAMMWDFPEVNIFGGASGDALGNLEYITSFIEQESSSGEPAICQRASATELPYPDDTFDAIITDPPYYDNESYAELSDVNYVWLRPAIGFLYPEHFASGLTPKRKEVVAAAYRLGGTKEEAYRHFEQGLASALREANRVLKPAAPLVMIYAHKTTVGWATVVDAIRQSGFEIHEAWPIDMESKARVAHQGDAVLKSNIFLVARKRQESGVGDYEETVLPELREIVRERVDSLWRMGIAGADLVIAAVGAGLRAYTRFARVEYANGEEVPTEQFLSEVEGLTLETLLENIFGLAGSGVKDVDGTSRFYVLWRYAYPAPEMDAGEAIVFTYGQNVELDGPHGLSAGNRALVEKKKGKYKLLDFISRGKNDKLGLPDDNGLPSPLIDTLHRTLWLMENRPRDLPDYLGEANPDRERLRLVAQVLAGTALEGSSGNGGGQPVHTTQAEHSALNKLLANWRSLMERGRAPKSDQQLGLEV